MIFSRIAPADNRLHFNHHRCQSGPPRISVPATHRCMVNSVRMGPQLGRNQARQQRRQEAKEARFDEMDDDGDGSITKAEFMTLAENHHMGADADCNGRITPWEHRRRNRN